MAEKLGIIAHTEVIDERPVTFNQGADLSSLPKASIDALREAGALESQQPIADEGTQPATASASVDVEGGTVEDVLAAVGDDPQLAAEALAAEKARGDKARSTLVDQLEQITGE